MVVVMPFPGNDTRPELVDGFIFVIIVCTFFLQVLAFGMSLVVKGADTNRPKAGCTEQANS